MGDGLTNLALLDFHSVQIKVVNCGQAPSTAVACSQTLSTACKRICRRSSIVNGIEPRSTVVDGVSETVRVVLKSSNARFLPISHAFARSRQCSNECKGVSENATIGNYPIAECRNVEHGQCTECQTGLGIELRLFCIPAHTCNISLSPAVQLFAKYQEQVSDDRPMKYKCNPQINTILMGFHIKRPCLKHARMPGQFQDSITGRDARIMDATLYSVRLSSSEQLPQSKLGRRCRVF